MTSAKLDANNPSLLHNNSTSIDKANNSNSVLVMNEEGLVTSKEMFASLVDSAFFNMNRKRFI